MLKFISDSDEFLLEFDKGRSLSFAIENFYKIPSADFQMATLPGKAQKYGQVWYYIVNRAAAEAQVDGYFPYKTEKFDIQNVFVYDM